MENFIGKIFFKIISQDDSILFYCSDGYIYTMHHTQDCCECVYLDDITGNFDDLIGSPILEFRESQSSGSDNSLSTDLLERSKHEESSTWTFYHIATIKGWVTIRWFGSSNGYYSESVDIEKSNKNYLSDWRDWKIESLLN